MKRRTLFAMLFAAPLAALLPRPKWEWKGMLVFPSPRYPRKVLVPFLKQRQEGIGVFMEGGKLPMATPLDFEEEEFYFHSAAEEKRVLEAIRG